jgi:hypothetical protein
MARFTIALFALIAAILAFAARRGTLHDLKATNESLRQRIDSTPVSTAPGPDKPSADRDQLNPDERAELLRLRGQILPLQQEIRDISNRIERAAALSSSGQTRIAQANTREEMAQKQRARAQAAQQAAQALFQSEPVQSLYKSATVLGQKLQQYLRENNNQLPQDLSLLNGAPEGFELIGSGTVSREEGRTFVARLKDSLQMPDGKMIRVYVDADGIPVLAALPTNGDWTLWEQRAGERARERLRGKPQ